MNTFLFRTLVNLNNFFFLRNNLNTHARKTKDNLLFDPKINCLKHFSTFYYERFAIFKFSYFFSNFHF